MTFRCCGDDTHRAAVLQYCSTGLRVLVRTVCSTWYLLTVCVVTTVAGTCLAVAVPRVSGDPETPGATVIPLAPPTTLAAMVTTLAHVDAVSVLEPLVVVMVRVCPCF